MISDKAAVIKLRVGKRSEEDEKRSREDKRRSKEDEKRTGVNRKRTKEAERIM